MTSLLTTMFVHTPSSSSPPPRSIQTFPSPPKALNPVFTLAESSSCIHLPPHSPTHSSPSKQKPGQTSSPRLPHRSPQQPHTSPVQRSLYAALRNIPLSYAAQPTPAMTEKQIVNDDDAFYRNSRTRAPFRPQKAGKGSTNWQVKQFAEATLGSGSLRKAVKLPEGEDEGEWLAVNGELHLCHTGC
jgi:hypothetical protein